MKIGAPASSPRWTHSPSGAGLSTAPAFRPVAGSGCRSWFEQTIHSCSTRQRVVCPVRQTYLCFSLFGPFTRLTWPKPGAGGCRSPPRQGTGTTFFWPMPDWGSGRLAHRIPASISDASMRRPWLCNSRTRCALRAHQFPQLSQRGLCRRTCSMAGAVLPHCVTPAGVGDL